VPCWPVKPWQMTLVDLLTKTLIVNPCGARLGRAVFYV
jgi:hypothetical protein